MINTDRYVWLYNVQLSICIIIDYKHPLQVPIFKMRVKNPNLIAGIFRRPGTGNKVVRRKISLTLQ
jgi:hypothetical protein